MADLQEKRKNNKKFKKINHHHVRNILLALILFILIIFLFKQNNYPKEPQNINITINNFDSDNILKNEIQNNFLNADKIFESIFCGSKSQDIRELLINHTVKSWYVDSFSKIKLSPKEINYQDNASTIIIYMEKSFDSKDFFIKTIFLKNNTNNEIIKKLDC